MDDNRLQEINDFLQNLVQKQKETIDKQEAEIERLKSMNQAKLDTIHDLQSRDMQIEVSKKLEKEIKAEAYKEFAERLKENSIATFSWNGVVMVDDIENLLKEMEGDV